MPPIDGLIYSEKVRRNSPLVIGHRGAPGYRPEHTRSSYELALAMGAGAVEPDVVASRDGVVVVRHENEISATTDVASREEFSARRTTKVVDGETLTGWFTEDFTWDEMATLRAVERLPGLRSHSARFSGIEPMLRLSDVLDLVRTAAREQRRDIGVVVEIKHATYFQSLGFDLAALVARELRESGWADGSLPLTIESFELAIFSALRDAGVHAQYIYLIDAAGSPADQVARFGEDAATFASLVTPTGLDNFVGNFDGISVDKGMLLEQENTIVTDAHARGLKVFTWTARPENAFLSRSFRSSGGSGDFGDFRGEWAALAATGVDGVFVDHPDLGVGVFAGD